MVESARKIGCARVCARTLLDSEVCAGVRVVRDSYQASEKHIVFVKTAKCARLCVGTILTARTLSLFLGSVRGVRVRVVCAAFETEKPAFHGLDTTTTNREGGPRCIS